MIGPFKQSVIFAVLQNLATIIKPEESTEPFSRTMTSEVYCGETHNGRQIAISWKEFAITAFRICQLTATEVVAERVFSHLALILPANHYCCKDDLVSPQIIVRMQAIFGKANSDFEARKEQQYDPKSDLSHTRAKQAQAIAAQFCHQNRNVKPFAFPYCVPDKAPSLRNGTLILTQRVPRSSVPYLLLLQFPFARQIDPKAAKMTHNSAPIYMLYLSQHHCALFTTFTTLSLKNSNSPKSIF